MKQQPLLSEFSNLNEEKLKHNFGLSVNSVGYKSILANEKVARAGRIIDYKYHFKQGRVSDEFKIIYITSGIGYVQFEGTTERKITSGEVLLVMPNQQYRYYHRPDTEWKEYFIRFIASSVYYETISDFFRTENQVVEIGFNEELIKLFHRAIEVVEHGLKSSQVYLSGLLMHLLGLIIAETRNKASLKKEIQLVEQIKWQMNEHIFDDISVQDIAARLNVSYVTLRMQFKTYTGMAPAKYFNELRLNKARQLLTETTHSVKEIACMLRFASTNHFSTMFRKTMGVSPKVVRQGEKRS